MGNGRYKVWLVDDQAALYEGGLRAALAGQPCELVCATRLLDALEHGGEMDVLVLDLRFPEQEDEVQGVLGLRNVPAGPTAGLEVLKVFRARWPKTPVVVLTGVLSAGMRVQCISAGAFTYVTKDSRDSEEGLDYILLAQQIGNAVRLGAQAVEVLGPRTAEQQETLVARSPGMLRVLDTIGRVARGVTTVLILGESGVGKEHVARFIHRYGDRADKPFVTANIGAFSEGIVESELFGHVRGAFTGAIRDRTGLFEAADGGTIFLDEIAEASAKVQLDLLRVLQEGEVRPVGGTHAKRVDVRVIAATNRDLRQWVAEGRFREDLYYRLSVVPIKVPPLRERPEEIRPLAELFVERACREAGRALLTFSDDALAVVTASPWPGNVRQLENCIARAVALAPTSVITAAEVKLPFAPEDEAIWEKMVRDVAGALLRVDRAAAQQFISHIKPLVYEQGLIAVGHDRSRELGELGPIFVTRRPRDTNEAETEEKARARIANALDSLFRRWGKNYAKDIRMRRLALADVPSFLQRFVPVGLTPGTEAGDEPDGGDADE